MHPLSSIRKHYQPIQPSVSQNNSAIDYLETQPNKKIEDFVYCFWQLKTKYTLQQDYKYRVVSDGCIDIFFNHKQPTENFVMGFCRKYTQFPIGKDFDYIGIRFLPSTFTLLFDVNAKNLSNQSQELHNILPDFSKWLTSNIKASDSYPIITQKLNEKLTEIIDNKSIQLDNRFLDALCFIFQKHGYLDTEKDLNIGLSARQLRRIFNYYIGTTAKSFSNVVRFQYVLNAKPSKQSLKENKLYYHVGFFDQAHFIKSFKTFYGVTPSEAFQ